jgi:ribonuclease P/MRP protein subunit POP3
MPEAILKSEGKRAPDDMRPFSMIILTHPKPSISPAHAHFPTLVHLSTLQHPSPVQTSTTSQTTRLVPLATSTDARLASTLHIPRVGALAIFSDAPGARALVDYVRQHVGLTECVWIDEAMKAEWKGVTVKSEVPGKEKVSSEDKE